MPAEDNKKLSPALASSPGFLLNKAARKLRDAVTDALKPVGLLPPELGVLKVVHDEAAPSQSVIADRCLLDRTTVTALIDTLEKRKLLVREASSVDRRQKIVRLTPLGRQILIRGSKAATRVQQDFFEVVSPQEWEAMRRCLVRYIEATPVD